jgi:hypothetical protein
VLACLGHPVAPSASLKQLLVRSEEPNPSPYRPPDAPGQSSSEVTCVDMALEELADFRGDLTGLCYDPEFAARKDAFAAERLPDRLAGWEAWLADGEK